MKVKIFSFLVIFIISCFFIVNLFNLNEYGISWDEPVQHQIGKANAEYLEFNSNISLRGDLIYYGPFYETINYFISNALINILSLDYIPAHHFLGILLSTIGLIFIYFLTRKMFDEKIATYSILLLSLYPWFIAHSHYNSKDIPLMVFSTMTISMLYLSFKNKNYIYSILAGLFFSISITTKINGLLILPIFFLPYLIYLIFELQIFRQTKYLDYIKKELKLILTFFISSVISAFITWPALWKDPLLFLKSISYFLNHGWAGKILYMGQSYNAHELPWHYAPIYLTIVTPLITLFLFFIGIYVILTKIRKREKLFEYTLIISWFVIPILIEMKPGVTIYDGIRHFFIIIPAFAIISGHGLSYLINKIKVLFPNIKYLSLIILIIISLILIKEIVVVHPYEGSYFNEAVRFYIPEHIENYFELEYWGTTYKEGIDVLNKNAELNSVICAPLANHLIRFYKIRNDLSFNNRGSNCNGNYLMFFTRFPDNNIISPLAFKISRYNSDLLYIYKLK